MCHLGNIPDTEYEIKTWKIIYRKEQKNWCSKHQRVHQERKHESCRYPNDKFKINEN